MKNSFDNTKLSLYKKITGTTIADLAGMNKFKPKGDCVLSMLGLVKEPFDEFYTKRGAIAESLAKRSLERRNHKCVVYDKFAVHFDNFPEDPWFGGLIDIELPEEKTLYEIKSKNIKDYDKISQFGDACQEEQAMHYGYLRGYEEVHIMWIFFDDISESEIREDKPLSTYKNLKMFEKTLKIDRSAQYEIHKNALEYYSNCLATQSIPFDDISDKYLELLKWKRPTKNNFSNGNETKTEIPTWFKVVTYIGGGY